MRKLKYTISRNALNQMYMSFLLPFVEYASVVWDGCSEQDSQTLQKIQNEAARLVTGLTRSVSLENLFKECGWTTLSKRRQQHKLSFMYKVNNGIVPSYIHDLIPPLVSEISNYPLRIIIEIYRCPSIELVSHKNHVFLLPLDFGTPLKMI